MADKLITGLMSGKHVPPKRRRPLKQRLKVPVAIAFVLMVAGVAVYKYINYREERLVHEFLVRIGAGQYDAAYNSWDAGSTYRMKEFLEDWGPAGYFTKGMNAARIVTSHRSGSSAVNVRVFIVPFSNDPKAKPIELRVDKGTQKLAFAP